MRDAGGRMVDVVAKLTGLSVDEIRTKRAAGESLASIAKGKGISADQVVAQALTVRKTVLDAKVKDGTITQAQEDAALANMKTRLTDRVNNSAAGGGCGAGGGMGRGGRGGGAGMGGACGGACTQAPVTQ
jgi:hypothetical protein